MPATRQIVTFHRYSDIKAICLAGRGKNNKPGKIFLKSSEDLSLFLDFSNDSQKDPT